ncbi:DUF305 domain-containing protein [Nocardioides jejuensis]|nr:DUF305 domain-containing protein [Nocardioides jejuensis]
MHPSVVRRVAAAVVPVALVLGTAACTAEESAAPAPRQTAPNGDVFNAADAAFASDLLKQRAEEFALIDLTVGRTLDGRLTSFLDDAREVRASEVDTTTRWLTDWGKEVPRTVRDHASEHSGAHPLPEVENASGSTFQDVWVAAWLAELEDSDRIASVEEKAGANADARDLAEAVDATNDDEADALEDLVG